MPIKWTNINSGGSSAAAVGADLLKLAGSQINTGLTGLATTAKNFAADRERVDNNQIEANTDAYLNEIAKYRTPEELQAAQQSGVLDRLRATYGDKIDQDTVRGAGEQRLTELFQRTNARNTFEDTQLAREQRPIEQQLRMLALQNKDEEFAAMISANPELRNLASIQEFYQGQERSRQTDSRADYRFGREKIEDGREDELHAIAVEDRVREKRINQFVTDDIIDVQDTPTRTQASLDDLTKKYEFKTNDKGEPDFTGAEPDKVDAYLKEIQDVYTGQRTPTKAINTFDKRFREQFPNATAAQRAAARENYRAGLTQAPELAPPQQAQINTMKTDLEARTKPKSNAYIQEKDVVPEQALERIIEKAMGNEELKKEWDNDGDYKNDITNFSLQAMREGWPVKNKAGETVLVPLTESQVNNIMGAMHHDWFENDETLREKFNDYVTSTGLLKTYEDSVTYTDGMKQIDATAQQMVNSGPRANQNLLSIANAGREYVTGQRNQAAAAAEEARIQEEVGAERLSQATDGIDNLNRALGAGNSMTPTQLSQIAAENGIQPQAIIQLVERYQRQPNGLIGLSAAERLKELGIDPRQVNLNFYNQRGRPSPMRAHPLSR